MTIEDLRSHPAPFVTVRELARYWGVSRQQIYKQIASGTLETLQFGPRLYRIRKTSALEFERTVQDASGARGNPNHWAARAGR